jgi:hypothetical protein
LPIERLSIEVAGNMGIKVRSKFTDRAFSQVSAGTTKLPLRPASP